VTVVVVPVDVVDVVAELVAVVAVVKVLYGGVAKLVAVVELEPVSCLSFLIWSWTTSQT
jgi:hypothetical protein